MIFPLAFIKVMGRKHLVKYIVGEKEENSYHALSGHCISPPISNWLNILEDRIVYLYKLHFLGKSSSSVNIYTYSRLYFQPPYSYSGDPSQACTCMQGTRRDQTSTSPKISHISTLK